MALPDPVAPHLPLAVPDDDVATIAVIGAIGPDKGARRLERLVALARERAVPVRFLLIGYMDVRHTPWQSDDARFTVHGRYDPRDLPRLFAHYRVALVLYPSAGPETFSYTLSEAWAAGLPVLVPPIGALAERVSGTGAGWVMSDAEWRNESTMLDRVAAIVAPAGNDAMRAAGTKARAMPHATLAEMADATFAVYEAALAHAPSTPTAKRFDRARVRDALGYRPWLPPVIAPPAEAPPATASVQTHRHPGFGTRVAHAALAIRHTAVGRAVYRVTPQALLDALKSRLRP
jgi:hypothetical protein